MANKDQIYEAIRKADAAGDVEDVKKLYAYLQGLDAGNNMEVQPAAKAPSVSPFPYKPSINPEAKNPNLVDDTPENYKKAAAAGVDITTGPPSGKILSSIADESGRQAYLKSVITKKYKGQVEFRDGKESGSDVLEYKPKGAERWIASIPISDPINLRGAITTATSIGAGLPSATAGALLGPAGATVAGAAGSTAGAAGGVAASNYLGKKLGVIPESSPLTQGAKEAAKDNAIGEAVSLGVYGLYKGARAWGSGVKAFKPHEAAELLNKQKSADNIINEVEHTTGMPFKPTTAEIVNAPKFDGQGNLLPPTKAEIKAGNAQITAGTKNQNVANKLQEQNQQNQVALRNYFKQVLSTPSQTPDKGEAGKEVFQGITDLYDKSLAAAKDALSKLPPGTSDEEAAKVLHESVKAAQETQRDTLVRPKYEARDKAIGFNRDNFSSNIQVPWSNDAKILSKQLNAQDLALAREFGESKLAGVDVGAKDPISTPPFHEWSMGKTEQPTVDLAVINQRIKELGDLQRMKASGDERVKMDEGRIREIKGAMVNMRDQYLDQHYPDVLKLQKDADSEFKSWIGKYDRAVTRNMLIKGTDGKFRFTEGQTLQQLLSSKDYGAVNNFADVVKAYPEAKSQVNHMLLALYRRDYTDSTGVPTLAQHEKFLKDYEPILRSFFGEDGIKEVNTIGGLTKKIESEDSIIKNLGIGAKYSTGDEISTLTPENLINQVVSGTIKPIRMEVMLNQLDKYPYKEQAISNWRSSVADELTKKITGQDGLIDPNKLGNFIKGDGMGSLIKLFNAGETQYGSKVASGLNTLFEASKLVNQVGMISRVDQNKSLLRGALRAAVGPLSRENNLITLGKNMRDKFTAERVYEALTDPTELRRLQDSLGPQVTRIKQLIGVGAAGGLAVGDDY